MLNVVTDGCKPLQAYKEGMGEGITELTEDASYMNSESVMKKEDWSSSDLRKASHLTQQHKEEKPKQAKVSAFEDQVKAEWAN